MAIINFKQERNPSGCQLFNVLPQTFLKIKQKMSRSLLSFVLKNRINNGFVIKIFIFLHRILNMGYYVVEVSSTNHHYIPQFLLRNFRIGTEGKIFEYIRGKAQPESVSIRKRAASIMNYYSFKDKKTKLMNSFLEKSLFADLLEFESKKIIDRILEEDYALIDIEESTLAVFVAFQYTRTPAFRSQIRNFMSFLIMVKGIPKTDFGNKTRIEELFIKNILNINQKELAAFNAANAFTMEGAETHEVLILQMIADWLGEKIFRFNWHILKAEEGNFFTISDSGVLLVNLENRDLVWPPGWDIERGKNIIFLPLSPSKCLFYCKGASKDGRDDANQDMVNLVNGANMFYSYEKIYSDRNSIDVQNEFNKTTKPTSQ